MLSAVVIYALFAAICVAAIARPWIGVVGFYFFAVLDPNWNWRWVIPIDFSFQKYIFVFLMAGWALSGFKGIRYRGRELLPLVCLVGFLGLAFLSKNFAYDPFRASWYVGYIWKIVLMTIVAAVVIDTPKKLLVLLLAVIVGQGWNAFQINLQYFEDGVSIYARMYQWGTKGNNNTYSILTIPVLAMSLALAGSAVRTRWRLLATGVATLQIHQIMLLESRGAMLGALVTFLAFAFFVPKTKSTVLAISCFCLAGALLAGPSVTKEFASAFASGENRDSSANSRFHLWQAGLEITKDYPLLGVGPACGAYFVPDYYQGGTLPPGRKELHNLFFEISTGIGLPAAGLYFGFFTLTWLRCYQRRNLGTDTTVSAVRLASLCGIPGYLFASMFSSGALLETPYILVASGLAASAIGLRMQLIQGPQSQSANRTSIGLAVVS